MASPVPPSRSPLFSGIWAVLSSADAGCVAALATTAEAIMAGQRFGIEPAVMLDILNNSTGRNTATELKYPSFVLPRTFNSGFGLGLMAKDLRIALDLARSVATPASLLRECADVWSRAEQRLGSGADHTEIVTPRAGEGLASPRAGEER